MSHVTILQCYNLIDVLSWPSHCSALVQLAGLPGSRSAKPPLMALLTHPLAAFPAVNWSKSTFANIYHVGYCRRIKCGNESWRVWGGIVPIKVELSGEICKFQNWGAKCRTRKIAPALYFLLLRSFGSLTYWLLNGNLVAEMFHGWPRTFFYMTRYYLCAFNGYFELGGNESMFNNP